MVIGFDASRVFLDKRTGTENYSHQLLKALAKIDRKNRYLIYLRPKANYSAIPWPENFKFKEINWPKLWTQGGLALQTFKDKLDVLFVPAHTLPLIRRLGLKTVVTVHDLGSQFLPQTHQLKQRLYLGLMQKYQLKTASKIIAVSQATKKDLVESIGLNPNKITVVYEGYDKNKFKVQTVFQTASGRAKFKVGQTIKKYNLEYQKYFLFVGTVQPRKNLDRLIKAFAQIESRVKSQESRKQESRFSTLATSDLKLVIAGSKGWLSDYIYKLPEKLGIQNRVKFLGYVPDENLPALYAGAKALLFPSLFEGFGLPTIEAQACGCPVLTSNLSSMPEIAGYNGAVLVDPYDINDIVKGVIEIQRSKIKDQKIKAGFENIKRFSWEKCAEETLEVLENVKAQMPNNK